MRQTKNDEANGIHRRTFLKAGVVVGARAGQVAAAPLSLDSAPEEGKIRIGVIGLGRGLAHVQACLQIPGVEVAYVCDVDEERRNRALSEVQKGEGQGCRGVNDLRRILDAPDVDAVSIATCNHWHAPATILACKAGKHVYVEKPGSHNAREGELMVEAAKKYRRVVQMGNQRRSWPGIIEGINRLHEGVIGRVRAARCWYTNTRPSIGRGRVGTPPPHLDYDLWQGPAPRQLYKDNLIHYNWHWHWHWGNGELGNNGVHSLDLARWGLRVDYPRRVTYEGGRYRYDDDQETPDTGVAVFDFGSCVATWEQSSCHGRRPESYPIAVFYGDGGRLALDGGGYVAHDNRGKEIAKGSGPGGDVVHFRDFFDAVRSGNAPHSEIGDAQKSTLLCHLGNIAYRTSGALSLDPSTGKPSGPPEALALWGREYESGWEPRV